MYKGTLLHSTSVPVARGGDWGWGEGYGERLSKAEWRMGFWVRTDCTSQALPLPTVRRLTVYASLGAADHQSADKQHSGPFDTQASTAATPKPDYTSTSTTADSITFHTPPAGRSLSNPRAASNSPGPVAPTTPDHTPALPPCKVNPMSSFPSKRASQHTGRNKDDDVLSSFQQLLRSPDGDQQDRMSKFRQLLASQEMDDEGKPLSGLAGRVRTMAAQLNALQKRTQVRRLKELVVYVVYVVYIVGVGD